jgi:hypothetical protein
MKPTSTPQTKVPLWVRLNFWRLSTSWGLACTVSLGSFILTMISKMALRPFTPTLSSEFSSQGLLEEPGTKSVMILCCLFFAATALVFHPNLTDFLKKKILERIEFYRTVNPQRARQYETLARQNGLIAKDSSETNSDTFQDE